MYKVYQKNYEKMLQDKYLKLYGSVADQINTDQLRVTQSGYASV